MAKRARPIGGKQHAPGVVEQQRLQKIRDTRRAVQQERQLVALGRQLRAAIQRTVTARRELAEVLARECGCELAAIARAAAVGE